MQFNTRVRMDQVQGMLNYDIVPIEVPKSIGESKGIIENPFLKIEMTRSNSFLVTTFGEYIGIKQRGGLLRCTSLSYLLARKRKRI